MKKCASFLILLSTVSFSQLLNFNFGSPYWVDMDLINEIKIVEKYSSLVNKVQPTGFRSVRWDATNKFGEQDFPTIANNSQKTAKIGEGDTLLWDTRPLLDCYIA